MTARRLHAAARLTFCNPVSLTYLALVAASAVFVTVDTLFVTHEDASFSGVWLLLLSAPTIIAFFMGADALGVAATGDWFLYSALPLSVLIQSFALGWFLRLVSGVSARPAHPQGM
ncbi:hypothetical protein AR457_30665 [Streptomyces agglomeratus]|uniref:Uncharacterized protein n=1 Tax=Streptomyces agglomeratus TaxID=285458 RepID=A0A1E5PF94_9ACTN|nr:hypothetical protein [Streptomyces agglomeratus]OEJ28186.1 hypothetical protein AS594_30555 [Streptomyces agglomeratus]OEJ37748.1 hypothetical protein BGK70_05980 [Streptomyces agglomeratus]OEJ47865.1 hypothetical protein AR457_30665 [Streptomyces agglomeratus]OEJ50285.1 hypothetical protein BGK72_05500 [Streptomyces agglomeratus]OEJ57613.1 hypothetical protein BGM19_06185 [Streptomyces agglomeratus]